MLVIKSNLAVCFIPIKITPKPNILDNIYKLTLTFSFSYLLLANNIIYLCWFLQHFILYKVLSKKKYWLTKSLNYPRRLKYYLSRLCGIFFFLMIFLRLDIFNFFELCNPAFLGYSLEKAQVVWIVWIVGMVGMVGIVGINK